MKRIVSLCALIAWPVWASENCVIQERVVSRSEVTIAERSGVRRDVVPYLEGQRKCVVDFRVRIGSEWHTAFGEYVWSGDLPVSEACGRAVVSAEDQVRERVGRSQTVSERTLVCKDDDRLSLLRSASVGTVGEISQFRPHPNYPNRFRHNGAQCRWFIEPSFVNGDIRNFQGVICELKQHQWVVVDKF